MADTNSNLISAGETRSGSWNLIAFLLLVIVGGSNAVAVRFSNLELPPFWGAATRFLAASLIFWVIILVRRAPLPKGRALIGNILYGVLSNGASYAFLYWGLLKIRPSLTMVILALGPLLTLILASAHRLEPFKWRGLAGALIAFAGITVAVRQELGSSFPLLSLLALFAGAFCIAEGSVIFKLFPKTDPLTTNGIATAVGSTILILISLLAGESWALPASTATWTAFWYLVVVGTVLLFYLYIFILSRWTASATSYSFLLFPIATAIISAWLTGEIISLQFVLGGLIVLFGVWLGAIRQPGKVTRPEPETTSPPAPGCV